MTEPSAAPLHPVARELAASQGGLKSYPPVERWDDWEEYDAGRVAAEGRAALLARPDDLLQLRGGAAVCWPTSTSETLEIRKFEGNPAHPGSRGRNCAKGPATLNQVHDPERILLSAASASGRAGQGQWERVTLGRGARRHRRADPQGARRGPAATKSCTTSAGPGHDGYMRARAAGLGRRRPQQPHERLLGERASRLRLLARASIARRPITRTRASSCCSRSHLETGHYFNPHAQRIMEAKIARRQDRGDRHAAVEHRVDGRLVAGAVARHRGGAAAGDRAHSRTREALRPRVRPPLGELGRVPARGAARSTGRVRDVRSTRSTSCTRSSRPEFAEAESGVPPRRSSRSRARSAAPARRFGDARLAQRRRRQPRRLAGRARARAARACSSAPSARRAAPRPTLGTSSCQRRSMMPPPGKIWNELPDPARVSARASTR